MDQIFEKITVFDKETKKFFNFSKLNLLFGYAESGKTSEISKLIDIFSGKNKKVAVNGTQAMPNDFNIINISDEEGVFSHLKLSSKSLVRKVIESNTYSNEIDQSFELVQKGFNQIQGEVESLIHSVLPGAKVEISHLEKPMSFLLDNLNISLENDSSSASKWQLFSVVSKLAEETKNQTLVFIDDFNSSFDEELTIKFFNKIKQSKAVFFLTTNKPIPQYLIDEETSIFGVRNGELISMPPLKELVMDSILKGPEYQTYEEYMLNTWYIKETEISSYFVQSVQTDVNSNVLRILTSKSPVLSPVPLKGKVSIVPKSKEEDKLYRSIFEILSIPVLKEE